MQENIEMKILWGGQETYKKWKNLILAKQVYAVKIFKNTFAAVFAWFFINGFFALFLFFFIFAVGRDLLFTSNKRVR